MIKVIKNKSMIQVRDIVRNGTHIGSVSYSSKNYAYVHQGKFIVYATQYAECERFHSLKAAIRFCL